MKNKFIICLAFVLSGNFVYSKESNTVSTKPEVIMTLGVNEKNNISTSIIESANLMEGITGIVALNSEQFILSFANITPTNATAALEMMSTDIKADALTSLTNSALSEMENAGEYVIGLKKSGHLPGVSQDSHGDMSVETPLSAALQKTEYPFTVTLDLVIEGDSLTNHYSVTRQTKNADWQLEKAWRTDVKGHTIKEWPVK